MHLLSFYSSLLFPLVVLKSTPYETVLVNIEQIPIFMKSKPGIYINLPKMNGGNEYVTDDELSYTISAGSNAHICSISLLDDAWNKFVQRWPQIVRGKTFHCLILEIGQDETVLSFRNSEFRNEEANKFVNLLSMCYKISAHNNFVRRFFVLDQIMKIADELRFNAIVMNEVWRVLLKNCKEFLEYGIIKRTIKTNHLNIHLVEILKNYSTKVQNNIRIKFVSESQQTLLFGNFKSSKLFISKYYRSTFHGFIMIFQKKSAERKLGYIVNFQVLNSDKIYTCLIKNDLHKIWDKSQCSTRIYRLNGSKNVECKCAVEGFVTIVEIGDRNRQLNIEDKLYNYWGFNYPWDFLDDRTTYVKEDQMRYLPVIAVMRMIVVVLSTLTLLVFIYLGFVLCLKKKRIFYAKETISVVIFLTCLIISHGTFHLLAYIGLVWIRKNIVVWCIFVTFFHINYVLSLCSFQFYVFIVSISNNINWLHNIALPILFVASPVAAGLLDGMVTVWLNQGCNYRVFNLAQNITLLFIVLPCTISTLLVPAMAMCSYVITRKVSRLYGYVVTFFFAAIHLLGGVFLWMTNTGEQIELQFYFQFCVVAIIESIYHALLAVFLLILSNTNTSLIDRHCTYDIDTRLLKKYFDSPKSAIQLMEKT